MAALGLPDINARLKRGAPLVQCITNTVTQAFTANVLLAVGASPAMLDHEADAGQFAGMADGLLVNLGTATSHHFLAADAAIAVMHAGAKPWVLDPVSVGVASYRSTRIRQAVEGHPSAIRGNASEILALAGAGGGGRGVDSTDAVDAVLAGAIRLAARTGAVVAISGERDAVIAVHGDTVRIARIAGGHPLMARVVGTGCSLGALVAAYLAADAHGPFAATVAAHAHFKLAGTAAAATAHGPGSFLPAFLDALAAVDGAALARCEAGIELQQLAVPVSCAG